ncbi:MAG: hypothetical protein PHF86_14445 [Candidatus Nanoarchaeia archaeon]|nr:hypothetical protein [Candidatus Nanoarchaeia archaeon]
MNRFCELQRKQTFLFKAYCHAYRENNKDLMNLWQKKLNEIQKYISKISIEEAEKDYKFRYNHICKSVGIIIKNNAIYNEKGRKVSFAELIEYWKGEKK